LPIACCLKALVTSHMPQVTNSGHGSRFINLHSEIFNLHCIYCLLPLAYCLLKIRNAGKQEELLQLSPQRAPLGNELGAAWQSLQRTDFTVFGFFCIFVVNHSELNYSELF
jgi:hypothetical protein